MSIGIDIVENKRVEELLRKFGIQFLKKFLTNNEIKRWIKNGEELTALCGIFAAKEAVIKAVVGQKLNLAQVEIGHSKDRIPFVILPKLNISISISHEKKFSVAVALFEIEGKILKTN